MDRDTCLIERSRVRSMLIEASDVSNDATTALLADVDRLPIVTMADKDAENERLRVALTASESLKRGYFDEVERLRAALAEATADLVAAMRAYISERQGAVDIVYQRWGCWMRHSMDREEAGMVLAISLGLGCLFNEDAEAEKAWMRTHHNKLRCSPLVAVAAGRKKEVLDLVNAERGL